MPNIEIKAHLADIDNAHKIANELDTKLVGIDHQVDTYFKVPQGRMKLRESSLSGATLIPYLRSNQKGPKKSLYALLKSDRPETSKSILTEIFGVEKIVKKERAIYLYENVRIHLDTVEGLGTFLEFEAVYNDDTKEAQLREQKKVDELMNKFLITKESLLTNSYGELVEWKND